MYLLKNNVKLLASYFGSNVICKEYREGVNMCAEYPISVIKRGWGVKTCR